MEYVETKKDCQKKIDAADNVCSQCGRELTPIETVDNSGRPTFWTGCEHCSRFDYGVTEIAYRIAKQLVEKENHVHYSHMDPPYGKDNSYKQYYIETQIGGTSKLVARIIYLLNTEQNAEVCDARNDDSKQGADNPIAQPK